MGAQLRVYRRQIKSVQSTQKITKAMELIAASRIVKAQNRVNAARPYADELTRALAALGKDASLKHPLLDRRREPAAHRHPAGHLRPRPGRRLQRQRDQEGQRAGGLGAGRRPGAGDLRHRPQGRRRTTGSARSHRRQLDRLLRAADLPRRPGRDRHGGLGAAGDQRGLGRRRARHRRAVRRLHPVRVDGHPDADRGAGRPGPAVRGRAGRPGRARARRRRPAATRRPRRTSSSPSPTSC